jgi:FAD/FMN-containing dehydrogenase
MTNNLPDYAAYPNYVDPTYTREQAHKLYYGAALLERLSKLKAILDPNNVFRNPQSIL